LGISRTGRTLAKVSKSLRSVTLALFSPKPTGVSRGPLSATRVSLMDAMVSLGTPLARPRLKTSAPASCSSHAMRTPVASRIARVAATTSGPMPSPAITVTRFFPSASSW